MPLKQYKPTTAGRRHTSVDDFADITATKPYKKLLVAKMKQAGRNSYGKITVRHQGGGVKQFYRMVDFKCDKYDIPARVETIEYDPNRSARIALVCYADGERRYVIAPIGLKVGDTICSSQKNIEFKIGNRMPMEHIPVGSNIYNIELTPGSGGILVRSAGNGANLMAVEGEYAHVRLPSTEIRMFPKACLASIGTVSNPEYGNIRLGLAGRSRHMGIRPSVRGKAMNPVDHPHGGGEGNCPIGLTGPKTPWGKPALGVKTRKHKRKSNALIVQRRKNK